MNDRPTDNLIDQLEELANRVQGTGGDSDAQEILHQSASEIRELIANEKQDAVNRLTAWLAHKLNNPLGTISGSAQLLARRLERDTADPDQLQAYLKYTDGIRSEIERCTKIINDLMEAVHHPS